MSKKKNTLKDLDEFLKQQAATFVEPEKLSEKVEQTPTPKAPPTPVVESRVEQASPTKKEVSADKILNDLTTLAEKNGHSFRKEFYDLIIKTLESQGHASPEDMMLINTALYLKNGDNWKESIRNYWKNK